MKKRLISLLFPTLTFILILNSSLVLADNEQIDIEELKKTAPKVFIDCQRCDIDYIRQELTFVNYVWDRKEADVHVLITIQRTGGGGREYTLSFIGQKEFQELQNVLKYYSSRNNTEEEVRRGLVNAVDLVRNGEDALYFCRINNYDVIVLDIMLPIKDGLTVCRELRSNNVTTPILMLTAKDSIEDKVNGLSQGADDYLTKPFSFDELLARIRSLFRRQQDYKTERLRCGELELNPLHRTVTLRERNIKLTGREFAILEYLMRNKGRIVTLPMIIGQIGDVPQMDTPSNNHPNFVQAPLPPFLG